MITVLEAIARQKNNGQRLIVAILERRMPANSNFLIIW